MSTVIAIETPLTDEMRQMIGELNEVLLSLSPPEACYHMTVEQMAGAQTTVFTARIDGKLAACGALHRHADGIAEVKRMFTRPGFQGKGLGSAILKRVIDLAKSEGFREMVLETGHKHPAAWHLYEKAGFRRCGAVLDYPESPYSVFYHMPIAADQEI